MSGSSRTDARHWEGRATSELSEGRETAGTHARRVGIVAVAWLKSGCPQDCGDLKSRRNHCRGLGKATPEHPISATNNSNSKRRSLMPLPHPHRHQHQLPLPAHGGIFVFDAARGRPRSLSAASTAAASTVADADADVDVDVDGDADPPAAGSPFAFGPLSDRYSSLSISLPPTLSLDYAHYNHAQTLTTAIPSSSSSHSAIRPSNFSNYPRNHPSEHHTNNHAHAFAHSDTPSFNSSSALPSISLLSASPAVPINSTNAHQKDLPSFSTSPYGPGSVTPTPALSTHSPRPQLSTSASTSGSPPLLSVSSGMVHKASLSPSAPSHKYGIICKSCGKKYKSTNCLAKHLWEHTEHWKHTSKFSITKHQQVQILEAASVLVGFTAPVHPPTPTLGALADHHRSTSSLRPTRTHRATSFGSQSSSSSTKFHPNATAIDSSSIANTETAPKSINGLGISVGGNNNAKCAPNVNSVHHSSNNDNDDEDEDGTTDVDVEGSGDTISSTQGTDGALDDEVWAETETVSIHAVSLHA